MSEKQYKNGGFPRVGDTVRRVDRHWQNGFTENEECEVVRVENRDILVKHRDGSLHSFPADTSAFVLVPPPDATGTLDTSDAPPTRPAGFPRTFVWHDEPDYVVTFNRPGDRVQAKKGGVTWTLDECVAGCRVDDCWREITPPAEAQEASPLPDAAGGETGCNAYEATCRVLAHEIRTGETVDGDRDVLPPFIGPRDCLELVRRALRTAIEELTALRESEKQARETSKLLGRCIDDEIADEERLAAILRPVFGDVVDGDSHGPTDLLELVQKLTQQLAEARARVEQLQKARNTHAELAQRNADKLIDLREKLTAANARIVGLESCLREVDVTTYDHRDDIALAVPGGFVYGGIAPNHWLQKWKARRDNLLAGAEAESAPTVEALQGKIDAADAANWRALVNCGRLRVIGTGSWGTPHAHMGLEMWATFPDREAVAEEHRRAVLKLVEFVGLYCTTPYKSTADLHELLAWAAQQLSLAGHSTQADHLLRLLGRPTNEDHERADLTGVAG